MSDKITLIVRFKLQEAAKAEFVALLKELFAHVEREVTFIEASLQQDLEDQTSLLVCEVWHETLESFMKNQMTREYRRGFEQAIVDLKVERTPSWYTSLAGCCHGRGRGFEPRRPRHTFQMTYGIIWRQEIGKIGCNLGAFAPKLLPKMTGSATRNEPHQYIWLRLLLCGGSVQEPFWCSAMNDKGRRFHARCSFATQFLMYCEQCSSVTRSFRQRPSGCCT